MNISKEKKIFDSWKEYMEAEDIIYKTLEAQMKGVTIGSKDI
ncbi:hypothetical protein OAA30_00100 [bacterium]|jgi:hypothetical protein|nr:hypothetical protein [bacterium]